MTVRDLIGLLETFSPDTTVPACDLRGRPVEKVGTVYDFDRVGQVPESRVHLHRVLVTLYHETAVDAD